MTKRIQAKERTLLLNSDVIKQFPSARKLLEENRDITDEFIGNLSKEQSNFFNNVLPKVLKQAINEWKGDPKQMKDMGTNPFGWMHCSLDNQPNRYIFYIINKLNGTSLNVGSECINHFWDSWGSNFEGKTIAQLKRDAVRVRMLNDLNDKIPGIEKIIDSWNLPVTGCEIILPRSLEKPYLDLGKRASALFEGYLNEKEYGDYEKDLKTILEQQNILISEIEEYVLRKYPEKFIPRKEIRIWLKNNGLTTVIDRLIDDGVITWGTAFKIEEPSFMKSIVVEINHGIRGVGLQVVSVDDTRRGYVLETIGKDKIQLFAKHSDLIFYCGWILFDGKPIEKFNIENTLQHCKLNSEADMVVVLRGLDNIASKLEIFLEDVDYENDIVTFLHKKTSKYILADISKLTEEFKGLVIGAKDKTDADLIGYVKGLPGKRYSKAELNDLKKMRKEFNIEKF